MTVEPDGMALFPEVGWVPVAGNRREDVEMFLTQSYRELYVESRPHVLLVQD